MRDLTCIYYTSNKEIPKLEENVRNTILQNIGDTQIISVSQKPIDFGTNICVGDKIPCSHNAFRQLQIGATEAKTEFVCTAEADTLYPKGYFEFVPNNNRIMYKADNIYLLVALANKSHVFQAKKEAEGAVVVGRDYLIEVIDRQLEGKDMWSDHGDYDGSLTSHLFTFGTCDTFHNDIPIVQFKTDNNLHRKTPVRRDRNTYTLPYWGESHDLMRKYL